MQLIDELVCAKSKLEKNVDSRTRFGVFSLVWMWISTCCRNMRTKLWKFCLITDIMNANTVCLEYWSWIVISKGVVGLALISVTWSEQHWYTILGLAPREKKTLSKINRILTIRVGLYLLKCKCYTGFAEVDWCVTESDMELEWK